MKKVPGSRVRILLFALIFGMFFAPLAIAACPDGDLDGDCIVNLDDLLILAEHWIDTDCADPNCGNLDGVNGVTVADFAKMAQVWQKKGSQLVINEFLASNSSIDEQEGFVDEDNDSSDWIEIYNPTGVAVNLESWFLTDNKSELTKWQFPSVTISVDGYLIVFASEKDRANPGSELHTNFKLSADGEYLALVMPDGQTVVSEFAPEFPRQINNISYGLSAENTGDSAACRYFDSPSPGEHNLGTEYIGIVDDTSFSMDRGFYQDEFDVVATCLTGGANIRYTLDFSEPTLTNGMDYSPGAPVHIDGTTCLRARAFKTDWLPGKIDTHTYIFVSDVISQSPNGEKPGVEWPNAGTSTNDQLMDYGMDPDIVNDDPRYVDLVDDALLAIPTFSLVTDLDNLFDASTGIYVNAMEDGREWERPTSLELIYPDGSEGFQIDAGLRIRGGSSRNDNSPKHSFRLLFRSIYGAGTLNYPLFEDEGADEFDKIDLRTSQNYSWAKDGNSGNTMLQDVFSRDTQKAMGQHYTRSRYYHLYINGQYWGIYQTQERSEAAYAETYLGGESSDYDVVKNDNGFYTPIVATDGNLDAYKDLYDLTMLGFGDNSVYLQAQGLNPDGTENPTFPKLLDVDNLIDYELIDYFVRENDGPGGPTPNNVWGIYSRVNPDGFKWLQHDSEHTMFFGSDGVFNFTTKGEQWGFFNPTWLHEQLIINNQEYRMTFADRAHKHFFNQGALMPEANIARMEYRAEQIDQAIIAESARWGDAKTSSPLNRDDHWLPFVNQLLNNFMPDRTVVTIDKFKDMGWYPNVDAPAFSRHGGEIASTEPMSMTAPAGTIWYTIDGDDPRLPGGGGSSTPTTLLNEDAAKTVLIPTAIDPSDDTWRSDFGFVGTGWTSGSGGVGYETLSGYESYIDIDVETQMDEVNTTCYIRVPFTFAGDPNDFNYMTLKMRYDDGFIAYLNGAIVKQINFSGEPAWNSEAGPYREAGAGFDTFNINDHLNQLRIGDNLLAIHGLNSGLGSSDFLICVELEAGESTPGDVSDSAIEYTGPINLTQSTRLKARALSGGTWSALNEAVFAVGPVVENLRITEIMYNPSDPNAEYVELKNIGVDPINIGLVSFTDGIDFTFPSQELAAGDYVLVAESPTELAAVAPSIPPGAQILGPYTGQLNDGGEGIELVDAIGRTIHEFDYKDSWYDITDGIGFSLTIKDPTSGDPNSWDDKTGWRPSASIGGSPGEDDSGQVPELGAIKINELLAHSNVVYPYDWIELYNTTGEPINIGRWYLSDNNNNLKKYTIPDGTSIGAYGYYVFYENLHFGVGNPADPANVPFALSENGETLYLNSGLGGVLTGYSEEEAFGASQADIPFGRYQKSTGAFNFVAMSSPTPGWANVYPKVGPVVISEIMYHPQTEGDAEYVEFLNISGSTVALQEWDNVQGIYVPWRFTDSGGITYDFPLGTTIDNGEKILLVKNLTVFEMEFGGSVPGDKFEWGSGKLANGGEKIQLSMPGDLEGLTRHYIRVDRVNYSDGSHPVGDDPWPSGPDGSGDSLTRIVSSDYGNDVANWQGANHSPGQ